MLPTDLYRASLKCSFLPEPKYMHKRVKKSIVALRGLCIGNDVLALEPIKGKILVESPLGGVTSKPCMLTAT